MVQVKKALRIGLVILGIFFAIIFISRNAIFSFVFNRISGQISNKFGLSVKAGNLQVKGISTFQIENLEITGSDTLFHAKSMAVKLNPFHWAILKVNPQQIDITDAEIKVDNLLKQLKMEQPKKTESLNPKTTSNSSKLYRMVKAFFGLSTATFNIENLLLTYSDSAYSGNIKISQWYYNNNSFTSTVTLNDGISSSWVKVLGKTSKKSNSITATLTSAQGSANIPFTHPFLGFNASFKKLDIDLKALHLEPGRTEISITSGIQSLWVEGKRIAQTPVSVDSCRASLLVRVLSKSYHIDSISTISLNGFSANLAVSYIPEPNQLLSLEVKTAEAKWQNLFDALPKGLFTNLDGIRTTGTFKYSIKIDVPLATPDSLTINPNINSRGFSVVSYGNANLAMLADTFTHKAYVDNVYIRDIKVNPRNPNYEPLNQISPYLQWAVITSEDGGFYYHRGFSLEGITYAMACNIKEGRFARGGSTITQQLVKNIFLNQNKNIGRKAEEIFITWIIENTGLVSKQRMLEIYLNIIEWGPNIFGIHEASQYYFGKKPSNLSLPEALFLAYIIPRPTKFRYLFDSDGALKPFVIENFLFVANKMLQHGNITQQEYDNLLESPQVTITGRAKELLTRITPDYFETENSMAKTEDDTF